MKNETAYRKAINIQMAEMDSITLKFWQNIYHECLVDETFYDWYYKHMSAMVEARLEKKLLDLENKVKHN